MRNRIPFVICVALLAATSVQPALAVYWIDGELGGTSDWLADVRFRNFNTTISDYEMMVNASPTRTPGQNQVNGQVPGPYAFAAWAQYNHFTITYDPLANSGNGWISLRLQGTPPRAFDWTDPYDVTIGRAPDAVTDGPVNYINFQLWDRGNFPTFPSGVTISALDGGGALPWQFSIPSAGIGNWSFLDPGGQFFSNGFTIEGDFDVDLSKLAEGREGDKIVFGIGYNREADIPEPAFLTYVGIGILGATLLRRRFRK